MRPLGMALLSLPLACPATEPGPGLDPTPALAHALSELAAPRPPQLGETLLLGLRVNGVPQPQTLRAVRVREGLALPQQSWDELHLKLPALPPRLIDGELHVVLSSSEGPSWQIEEASQTLLIEANAGAFRGQQLDGAGPAIKVTLPQRLGFFLNYDAQWQRRLGTGGGRASTDALLEFGALAPRGDLNNLLLYRNDGRLLRLDTRWSQDRPERLQRWRLGDSIGQPGAWGRAMRFGGLQWGTDFSLRPGFLSFPLPALRGEAALPSTVDVYVNNSQRLQGRLQPGAFDIADLPIVTGQGEIRTVVRDLLGREQVLIQPYYVSPALLKPGLHAYSVEAGWLRQDYGLQSNHYGRALLALTDRAGLSEHFTYELRAELLRRQQTLGLSGIWLWPTLGTANISLALSRNLAEDGSPGGRGVLLAAGLERQSRDWSGSLQLRRASPGFAQLGQPAGSGTRWSQSAAVGRGFGGWALGLSYVHQSANQTLPDALGTGASLPAPRLLSLNLARNLGDWGYLGLFLLRDLASGGGSSLALSWSYALDERLSGGVSLQHNRAEASASGGAHQLQLSLQQNSPYGEGLGWQLMQESGGRPRSMAQAYWQGERASWSAGAARVSGSQELRAGVSGALAWLDGEFLLARRIEGGFAVVQVGDYQGVRVLHDNQVVAHTDERGRAFVGRLRGYQANRVGINAADLPYDAELEALELQLTPAARSAALISFPVSRSRAATFRVVDAQGLPLPPGSELQLEGQARAFPVGLDGKAFVSGLGDTGARLRARWSQGECRLTLQLPVERSELPELGTLTCR